MTRYNKNRVLLVSFSSSIPESIGPALEANGFEVFLTETGQKALRTMRERLIDVIILDQQTPFDKHDASSDKFRTLEAITDASPLLPLVLICGRTTELSYEASRMADIILRQPFDTPTLLDAVETVLEETLRERAHRKAGTVAILR